MAIEDDLGVFPKPPQERNARGQLVDEECRGFELGELSAVRDGAQQVELS